MWAKHWEAGSCGIEVEDVEICGLEDATKVG